MNILLTGATGFLGSHLLKGLLQNGYGVVILKRSASNCSRIEAELNQCKAYDADQTSAEQLFRLEQIDAVIHCATEYGRNQPQTEYVIQANLIFPLSILEAAIAARCLYFINTDSFFTKQLPERFHSSTALYMPEYTLSKYQFREWGRLRAIEQKISFINLQMEHIYGPDDSPGKFIPFLIQSMQNGVESLELTDGIQIRDFVHVEDVVTAYLVVLEHLAEFSGYCSLEVGTGESHTIREMVESIRRELGAKTALNFGALPRKETEIMYSTAHPARLKQLGWMSEAEEILWQTY